MKKIALIAAYSFVVSTSLAAKAAGEIYCVDNIDDAAGSRNGRPLYLIDGELFVPVRWSSSTISTAKPYESRAHTFEIQESAKGKLIILRPTAQWVRTQTERTLKLEGQYLTGDYTKQPPSIKFVKEPQENSYWEIPDDGKIGPIVNKNSTGKPSYLTLDETPILLTDPTATGYGDHRKVHLSFEVKNRFRVRKFDPKDDGK